MTDGRRFGATGERSDPSLLDERDQQTLIADKGYRSAELEATLAEHGATLIRPAFTNEPSSAIHTRKTQVPGCDTRS